MKNKWLWLGMLAIVLVLGMLMSSCAAYMRWVRSVDPDFDSRGTITVFPSDSGGSSGSSGGSSQGGGSQGGGSQGGGTQGGGGTSAPQQPETIIRSYTFNVPSSGQAGGGAAAIARQEAHFNAAQQFERENPGFEIRNIQTHEGIGTITITITGRRRN